MSTNIEQVKTRDAVKKLNKNKKRDAEFAVQSSPENKVLDQHGYNKVT